MSFDSVSNYTLNKYQSTSNFTCTCTCQQQNYTYSSVPALFNFYLPSGFEYNFTPINYYSSSFINPFLFQITNSLQFLNNFNFSLPTPVSTETNSLYTSMISPSAFGTLTMPAPTISTCTTTNNSSREPVVTSSIPSYSTRKATLLKDVEKNDSSFADQLKEKGVEYNEELGHNLAKYTINHTKGTTGKCAHYVNNALEEYDINAKRDEHAYTRADVLAADENFTEVTVKDEQDLKKLPGGSVVVYEQGACGYSSEHGHVFIATGNGGAASDHLQNNIKYGSGVRVFIPTKEAATA